MLAVAQATPVMGRKPDVWNGRISLEIARRLKDLDKSALPHEAVGVDVGAIVPIRYERIGEDVRVEAHVHRDR